VDLQPLPPAEALSALKRIEHIVVLMLENRSFDHMLGYLRLAGRSDVDGLRPTLSNTYKGRVYPVHHLGRTRLERHEDPSHSGKSVARQLAEGTMGGFVANYVETRKEHRDAAEREELCPVMGYYEAADLPIYDALARHFCVCDRWFASVPGATWPNRLYAVAGESEGRFDNKKVWGRDFPLYFLPSFVRHLDNAEVSWRWYHAESADLTPPTLQLADPRYMFRPGGNFALIESEEPVSGQRSFLQDAAEGRLPHVAWLDPNFFIGRRGTQNDDHPPADVLDGQDLVRKVSSALMNGPGWKQTLFVITYDEHGGFYDHVAPPPAADDREAFRVYGVRVPALVVSPWTRAKSVSHVVFDHTSIIKTVLERFCRRRGALPPMGARVDSAQHLGVLLAAPNARRAVQLPELPPRRRPQRAGAREDERIVALRATSGEDLPAVAERFDTEANDLQLGLAAAAGEAKATRTVSRDR
jgi:phospholipase C